jgi:hypothetical protein
MITLTSAETQQYCLAIAQIVPVFLIALLVLNAPRFSRTMKRVARENVAAERKGRKSAKKKDKLKAKLIRRMVRVDSLLIDIELGISGLTNPAAARKELIEIRRDQNNDYRELFRIGSALDEQLESAPRLREGMRSGLLGMFAHSVIVNSFLGIAAEIVALWTAIGIVSKNIGIAWITNFTILLVSFLGSAAIERLASDITSRILRKAVSAFPFAMLLFAQLTFLLILFRLKIVS